MTKVRTRSNSASASVPVSKQVKIQFQFNGADLGEKGTVDVLNFVIASGGTVTRSGDTIIVTITGGSGSSTWGGITGTLSAQTDLQAELDLKENKALDYEQSTGTATTLNINHAGKVFRYNQVGAGTVTVPPNASVAYPIGQRIYLKRVTGGGALTVVQGAGVTITSSSGVLTDAGVNVLRILIKTASDAWDLDTWAGVGGSGDVVGPASAVADRIAVFDSTSGKLIKDGGVTVAGLQPIDADLTAIAALTSAADKLPYATGAQAWALTDLSSFIRTLLDDATAADARTTLGITAGWTRVTITDSVVNNNGTPDTLQDVDPASGPSLEFPVVANKKFAFKFFIIFDSAATTTGSRWTLNGPALTELDCGILWSTSVSAIQTRQITTYESSVLSAASALAGGTAELYGIIECSAVGNVIARFSSEIAGSAITVLEGSYVEYVQLD